MMTADELLRLRQTQGDQLAKSILSGGEGVDALYGGFVDENGVGAGPREFNRENEYSQSAANRAGYNADFGRANEAAGYQNNLYGGLAAAMAGDPNSVAQQALRSGMGRANSNAASQAASQRGGMAARALATRTAANQVASNGGQGLVRAQELQAQEQLAARSQMGGLLNSMGGAAREQAYGQSDIDMRYRGLNADAENSAIQRGLGAAEAGMQGEAFRQNAGRNAFAGTHGINNQADAMRQQAGAADAKAVLGAVQGGISGAGTISSGLDRFLRPGTTVNPSASNTARNAAFGAVGAK